MFFIVAVMNECFNKHPGFRRALSFVSCGKHVILLLNNPFRFVKGPVY
jgi:hypothetical protein